MLAKLLDDHERIAQLAAELSDFIAEDAPPFTARFAQVRWNLARELSTHLAVETQILKEALRQKILLESHANSLDLTLGEDLRQHIVRWPDPELRDDWFAYRQDLEALLTRLQRRVEREETRIYPAIFGSSRLSGLGLAGRGRIALATWSGHLAISPQ
ncbi:hemerythrin domain-containing protein [Novosphingopyxis iocasae]|uniref:hemerythrin domain-containing protein n=1 Tax=Novosphingopyxis iocasae TaxID=2762729 RepID=UPI0016517467|nr:hemerythrin domain-containing protein [Novosphingopyxis iocasae]